MKGIKVKKKKVDAKDIFMYLLIAVTGAAAFLWMVQPVFWMNRAERTSHPVRVYERDVETLVYGYDSGTEFVPGIYTGGLIISPEEDFYNSVELMARCVEAEAGNQGLLGKRMVADVILNRVRDEDFPDTIVDVITEKQKEYAFTSYCNGMMDKVTVSEETWEAVRMELEEVGWPGLLYFNTGDYSIYGTPWNKIGDHYFSTK